ncbi:hypothetical protein LEMLEM_LOCUS11673, partial [Lemmus lemmus]
MKKNLAYLLCFPVTCRGSLTPNLERNKELIGIEAKCFKYSLFIIKLNIMTKKWEISTSQ